MIEHTQNLPHLTRDNGAISATKHLKLLAELFRQCVPEVSSLRG